MKVEKIAGKGCGGGTCPAVYRTDQGSFVMQGKFLPQSVLQQLNLGSDETAVELPSDVVAELLAQLR